MDFALPEIGEGVYEAELTQWFVEPGATVKRGQNLLEVMTDKATMEVPSPFIGTIAELKAELGSKVKVGQFILSYKGVEQPAAAAAVSVTSTKAAVPVATAAKSPNGPAVRSEATEHVAVKAAPSVRYLARKLGIDLSAIPGTGPEGRILLDDVTSRLKNFAATERRIAAPKPAADFGKPGTRIKLQGLRRRSAEHMVQAKQTIPHYSYVEECEVTDLVKLRESLREPFAAAGVKLTYLPFFIKAVVAALKEVPIVNASLVEADSEIVLHDRYHIGMAVSTPNGLIVPVLREADKKDIPTLAREIERLSNDARNGKSKLDDLRGGTFTITSVGNLGGLFSAPIINHPEVGILGLGKIVRRPVFDEAGQVRPADLIYLSLSFDHRVVDGAVCAAFTNAILRQMMNPAAMLLPGQL